jgi:hypothetical protein
MQPLVYSIRSKELIFLERIKISHLALGGWHLKLNQSQAHFIAI